MIVYRRFRSKRKFGVEWELEKTISQQQIANIIKTIDTCREVRVTGWDQTVNNSYWHVKYDSTCGVKGYKKDEGGWEIASYVASGHKDVATMGKVAKALKKGGATVNQNCGIHVHVDLSDFTQPEAAVLVARWMMIESILPHCFPRHRVNNKYCRFLSNGRRQCMKTHRQFPYTAANFWLIVRPTNLGIHENRQKKVALNLVNYAAALAYEANYGVGHVGNCRKTAEFRMAEGSFSSDDVSNWVRIFVNFVESSKDAQMPDFILPQGFPNRINLLLSYFGVIPENDDFFILSKGLFNAKKWLLRRFVRFGTARYRKVAAEMLGFMEDIGDK